MSRIDDLIAEYCPTGVEFRDLGDVVEFKRGTQLKSNSAGLQMADLIARPVGMKILRPDQPNRAYDIIERKFYRNEKGQFKGWGLKCFP